MQQVKTGKWVSGYGLLQRIKIRDAASTTSRRVCFSLTLISWRQRRNQASTLHSKRSYTPYLNARTTNGNPKLCKTITTARRSRFGEHGAENSERFFPNVTPNFVKKEWAVPITLRFYLEAQRFAMNFQQIQRAHFPYNQLVMKLLGSYRLLSTRCVVARYPRNVLS